MNKLLILALLLVGQLTFATSPCGIDFIPFQYLEGGRALSEIEDLKVASYNVLNLNASKNGITKNTDEVLGVANVIKSEKLDIVVLQEVQSMNALELLNKNFLNGEYKPLLISGNGGSIEIAFLVKKDLPLKLKLSTNRDTIKPFIGPRLQDEKVFSRDLPGLHIWGKNSPNSDPPDFVIFGPKP